MATADLKSAMITARDVTPKTLVNPYTNAPSKSAAGLVTCASTGDSGSIYKFCTVPSNCYVRAVLLTCVDIGTTTVADFGCYYGSVSNAGTAAGTVIDADFFGSAVSLKDGALTASNITHESGVYTVANLEKPLWQALGLSSDPNCDIDICATLTAACDGSGAVFVEVRYV